MGENGLPSEIQIDKPLDSSDVKRIIGMIPNNEKFMF